METDISEQKLSEMVMCGDHPSFTATKKELNSKELKDEKERKSMSYARVSPSSSRTCANLAPGGAGEMRSRLSENALRMMDARRRVRSLEQMPRQEVEPAAGNRALVQAALGSFRWPPYLLAVWVVVLVLTHLLHFIVTMLERAMPNIKKLCLYLRAWTEESWRENNVNYRVCPLLLCAATAVTYGLYYMLYVIFSVALWSIEPLCGDQDDKQSAADVLETKITNYVDEVTSKTNIKH